MSDQAKPDSETSADPVEEEQDETKKAAKDNPAHKLKQAPGEVDGPPGPEPTRYGDWENKGIASDF